MYHSAALEETLSAPPFGGPVGQSQKATKPTKPRDLENQSGRGGASPCMEARMMSRFGIVKE